MNIIRNEPETLHIGADFNRGYRVAEGFDLTGCTATMKVGGGDLYDSGSYNILRDFCRCHQGHRCQQVYKG